ncbi:MAG: siphovirus Gp157 family protein [Sedimentisphaerales bacterium]|nr:siphovirus Gp157 family protein [Sedimentisphaerales bacterium]
MAKKKVKATEVTPEQALEKREAREMSLYDYRQELAEIEKIIGESGELTEEQAAAIVELHAGSIEKMKTLVWITRRIGDGVDQVKAEIDRLKDLLTYRLTVQDRIETALLKHVLVTQPDTKKIDLDTYILSAHKCPASVIINEEFSDPFLCKIASIKNPSSKTIDEARANGDEIVTQPDKKAIKDALLAGEEVPGATLIDNKYRLVVK